MSVTARETTLLHSQTITANGVGPVIMPPAFYGGAILYLSIGIPTGTSPTLDIYIQQGFTALLAGDTVDGLDTTNTALPTLWDDYAHFTQATFSASAQGQVMRISATSGVGAISNTDPRTASVSAFSDAALGSGLVRPGPLGMFWRVKFVVGGTSPSWPTVFIIAQYLNEQG